MSAVSPSESLVQQEALQYNQPVSEAAAGSIAALANAIREIIMPVGTLVYSMLDESTFQAQNTSPSPVRWIIADGRDVTGSRYQTLTGSTTVPDLRGVFVRGKNGARSSATGNPDGDLALGTYTADKYLSHSHGVTDPGHAHGVTDPQHSHGITDPTHSHSFTRPGIFGDGGYSSGNTRGLNVTDTTVAALTNITINANGTGISVNTATTGVSTNASGGNETSPRNVTLNPFIRIN